MRNNQISKLRRYSSIAPREEALQRTLETAKMVYFQKSQGNLMPYGEFLWTQLGYIRKRWWVLQGTLLLLAAQILPVMELETHRVRSLGVFGCLFVIFMIPELWRNKENNALQIEAACFYSLRQMYAARITLFGIADVVMLTAFGGRLFAAGYTGLEIMSQFLLPVTVTACICFYLLCGKQNFGESLSVAICLTWSGLWWPIVINEGLYQKIIPGVWIFLFLLALLFLMIVVRKAICTTNRYWEVNYT